MDDEPGLLTPAVLALRQGWRFGLGVALSLGLLSSGWSLWSLPPLQWAAEAVIVIEGKERGVMLGRLNSRRLAQRAGFRAGQTVQAWVPKDAALVTVRGVGPTEAGAVEAANGIVAALDRELMGEAARTQAGADSRRREELQQLDAERVALLAMLPESPGPLFPIPVTTTPSVYILDGVPPKGILQATQEGRYTAILARLAELQRPGPSPPPSPLTVIDPATAAVPMDRGVGRTLRVVWLASGLLAMGAVWVRPWWRQTEGR